MRTAYDLILGVDVGKSAHHGCALSATGGKIFDQPDKVTLRDTILWLSNVLYGVDVGKIPVVRALPGSIWHMSVWHHIALAF